MLAEPRTAAGRSTLATIIAAPAASAVVLDFDGTLSAIELRPEDAHLVPGALEALTGLVGTVGQLALLTGRPAAQAVRLSGVAAVPALEPLTVLGQYGVEEWRAGVLSSPRAAPGLAVARERLPALLTGAPDGVHVEDKGLSLAVHTRPAADPAAALAEITPALLALAADTGLEPVTGSLVLELRSPGGDKGTALRRWVLEAAVSAFLYAGDDDGDIPVLAAAAGLRGQGISALVICAAREDGSAEFRDGADLVLDGPEGVVAFLTALLAAIGSAS